MDIDHWRVRDRDRRIDEVEEAVIGNLGSSGIVIKVDTGSGISQVVVVTASVNLIVRDTRLRLMVPGGLTGGLPATRMENVPFSAGVDCKNLLKWISIELLIPVWAEVQTINTPAEFCPLNPPWPIRFRNLL